MVTRLSGIKFGQKVTVQLIAPLSQWHDELFGTIQSADDIAIRMYVEGLTCVIPWTNIAAIYWENDKS